MSFDATRLPATIESFNWDRAGWNLEKRSPARKLWRNATSGDIIVQDFGPSTNTGLPPNWRDPEALRARFEPIKDPKMAYVSIEVVTLPGPITAAQYIHKERMAAPSLGMAYAGTIALPFARLYTRLIFIAMEHGTTGVREAVLVAQGKVPMPELSDPPPTLSAAEVEQLYRDPPPPRRTACDDEQWDALFPEHPLSRVRTHLRRFHQTLTTDATVRAEPPFAG